MAREKLSMRKIQEVLRLRFGKGLGYHQIAGCCGISTSTAQTYAQRAEAAGLGWPLPEGVDERELHERLFPESSGNSSSARRPLPNFAHIHSELRRRSVTLQLLWEEYRQEHPDGYQYSQFCVRYRRWAKKVDVCLRQRYVAGEKLFVDFAGQTIPVTDAKTGKVRHVQVFVAVLGASSYTFAEARESQQLPDWTEAHVHAFEFFGGVPAIVVPDNLKSGVTHPCRYEPELNPTYQDLAEHYGTAVIPARVRKPRDKAKAEAGVLLAERWIIAVLRNRTFFSLGELNQAIGELLVKLNERPFKKMPGSRAELFRNLDAPALQALPAQRYEFADWLQAGVNIDYHIYLKDDDHYYSVPYALVQQRVDVRLTIRTVEVFFKGRRVAVHPRSSVRGDFTLLSEHQPKSHRKYLEWTPSRIIDWAAKTGPGCAEVADRIMKDRPHPEQGYRACLGLIRLAKDYGKERMEAACGRALALGICSYRSIKSMLKTGMDSQPVSPPKTPQPRPNTATHVRGATYYK